jgi:hypothetical protein
MNRNIHHKPTFHPLGDFLNPALALLGQGLKKSPIGQKLSRLSDILNRILDFLETCSKGKLVMKLMY